MFKNIFKYFFVLLLVLSLSILSGCGEKKTQGQSQALTIGNIKISLPVGFDSNSISSDQFSGDGQIIGSYRKKMENGFSDNIVVSANDLFTGFSNGHITKLQKNLNPLEFSRKSKSINCNKNKIDYDLINFKISQAGNLDKSAMDIFYSQAYIQDINQGYIISFSTNDINKSKNYENVLKSISCK